MATRKTAKKTSKKASVNIGDFDDVKIKKSTKNKTVKMAKNTSKKAWLFAFLFFVIGIVGGISAYFITSKNDCFDLIGKDELTLTLDDNDRYTDEGVKIISFGKDISDQVVIDTNLKQDENGKYYSEEIGTYYIKYSSKDFKFGKIFKIEKVRLITFVEPSEGGE